MKHLIQITITFAFAAVCPAVDVAETERKVMAAYHAADGLAGVGEYDLRHLIHDGNRNFLGAIAEDGGTIRVGHTALKTHVELMVADMGDVTGKYAEAALLIRELARLGCAEMEMVLSLDPINKTFVEKAAELKSRIAQVRDKLNPLLPPDAEPMEDPPPSNTY